MAKLEDLGEVISTDMLIIGGGIGGLVAALKAKETNPEVNICIVDKATIGWAGAAPKVGGALAVLAPNNDADTMLKYHVENLGFYLNDQDFFLKMVKASYGAAAKLVEWGSTISKNPDGTLKTYNKNYGSNDTWSIVGFEIDAMLPLRSRARKQNVKLVHKVMITDLLKDGDRIVGAVGFSLLDSKFYIFKAKTTMLANGQCVWKMVHNLWEYGTGDGIAAAYRAGAEMRNGEWGSFAISNWKDRRWMMLHYTAAAENLFNNKGENICEKYGATDWTDGVPIEYGPAMENELREGRGPIMSDYKTHHDLPKYNVMPHSPEEDPRFGLPKLIRFHTYPIKKAEELGLPDERRQVDFTGPAGFSPVRVDHQMRTTLPGLWAIGDTSANGSSWAGAAGAPPGRRTGSGWGLGYAIGSALFAAPDIAAAVAQTPPPSVDYAEVKKLKDEALAPLGRSKGLSPEKAIYGAQEIVAPLKVKVVKSKDRLEGALAKNKALEDEINSEAYAKDGHGLMKVHEARSMAGCNEIFLGASLVRTETRHLHRREDFPERDDKNWLKWVILKKDTSGKMGSSAEPVPIEKYKFKP